MNALCCTIFYRGFEHPRNLAYIGGPGTRASQPEADLWEREGGIWAAQDRNKKKIRGLKGSHQKSIQGQNQSQ